MTNNQNFDVHLPPYHIEPETGNIRMRGRPVSWGVQYLRAPEVWSRSQGAGVIAFVVDTEDFTKHPDVKDNFLPEYSRRFTNEGPDVDSIGGHGLHVADTILQIAPEAGIVLLKGLTNEGSGYSTWIAAAIRHAANVQLLREHQGFKRVINLSLGSDAASPSIKDAITYARSRGVEVFAAAGNDGRDVDYPGAFADLVLTIGAIDKNSQPAAFSSPGPEVDLACPGVRIDGAWGDDGYVSISGTSMATPHAVGVACLVLSVYDVSLEIYLFRKLLDIDPIGRDDKTGGGVPLAVFYFDPVDDNPTPDPEPEPVPDPVQGTPIWVWIGSGGFIIGIILWFIFGNNG